MSSTNKTANLQLNQWVGTDPVIMSDFNADNQKIDTAVKANADAIAAAKATADSAAAAASSNAKAIADVVNNSVKLCTGTYTGTGVYGSGNGGVNKSRLTFPFPPKLVFISGGDSGLFSSAWIRGCRLGQIFFNDSILGINLEWSGSTLIWYSTANADYQLNASGQTYVYYAIG